MVQLILAMNVRFLGWIRVTWVCGRGVRGRLFIEVLSKHGVVGRNAETGDVIKFMDIHHGGEVRWRLDSGVGRGKGNVHGF
jgi:hypothetical protein